MSFTLLSILHDLDATAGKNGGFLQLHRTKGDIFDCQIARLC